MNSDIKTYPGIGSRRSEYKAPRPCPYTGWVETLYGPEYSNPANVYLLHRLSHETVRRELIFNLRLCIAMMVFMAILTYVFN